MTGETFPGNKLNEMNNTGTFSNFIHFFVGFLEKAENCFLIQEIYSQRLPTQAFLALSW